MIEKWKEEIKNVLSESIKNEDTLGFVTCEVIDIVEKEFEVKCESDTPNPKSEMSTDDRIKEIQFNVKSITDHILYRK